MWVIELLTTEAMVKKPAYWKEVFKECKFSFDAVNDEMSFIKLIKNGVLEHRGIIEELSKKADKQWGMEKKLMDIVEKLKELKLELFPYKATYTLKGIDELQQTIDDYLNIIGMMKQSSFIKPVQKECNKCDSRLQLMQDTLDGWIKCQRNWMYLQPIFASEDITQKMPLEKQKFACVDMSWRATMD
jgi:dynein heavy chain